MSSRQRGSAACRDEFTPKQLFARAANTPLERCARVGLALVARLFPNYLDCQLNVRLDDSLVARMLMDLEQLDNDGRLRRIFGYGRFKLGELIILDLPLGASTS